MIRVTWFKSRVLGGLAFAVCSFLFSACGGSGGDTTDPIVTSVAGTWSLASINGVGLPFLLQASDPKTELTDKQYVFSATGTFTASYGVRETALDGSVTTARASDSGTYTLADNVVTLQYASDGSIVAAQVSANTMTISAGAVQVYRKQ